MSLADIVAQQLDEILSEAEPAWLDREPEVREEVSFVGFDQDTYAHQHYWYSSQKWEEEAKRRYNEVFGPQSQQPDDPMLKFLKEMFDGPTP